MRHLFVPVFLICNLQVIALAAEAHRDADSAKALIEQAQKGDPELQLQVAQLYRDGSGVERDHAKALHWARLAADQGHADAINFVGYQYYQGWGVPKSFPIAFGYFKAVADKSSWAMFNLGDCYFGVPGVDQDMTKAVECWKKAGEMGHGAAAAKVAMAYMSGEGAAPNKDDAARWAAKAADFGRWSGWVILGELKFEAGQIDAARDYWQKAAAKGDKQAADLLILIDYRTRKAEPGQFGLIESPHVYQGYNNCGATSCTMLARSQGAAVTEWDIKLRCTADPIGTGTDWSHLVDAAAQIGLHWKIRTFIADDNGFEEGTNFLRSQIDAGRPVVIDYTYVGPQYPSGHAGHTVVVTGYIKGGKLFVIRNPGEPTPGLQLVSRTDLDRLWRSSGYSHISQGVVSRPLIVIDAQ